MQTKIRLMMLVLASLPSLAMAVAKDATAPAGQTLWQPYRITPRAGAQHIELGGGWLLGWRDAAINNLADLTTTTNWFATQVPSSVQWALYRAGKLPHPYEHLNSQQYDWVDQKVWYYQHSFRLPAVKKDDKVLLCFDGIDYFARVWLNGQLLGRHEGMFGGPAIEVRQQIRVDAANEVVVEVRSGNYGNKTGWKPMGPAGTVIKPWVIAGGVGGEMFFPLGMWRGARVEIVPAAHLERPFLVTEEIVANAAKLSLKVEVFTGGDSLALSLHPWKNIQLVDGSRGWGIPPPLDSRFALGVTLAEKTTGKTAFAQTFPLQLLAGRNFVQEEFSLSKPSLWWPNGMGDPNLYRVKLELLREGQATDTLEFDCGVRTIKTVPTPGPRTADRWGNWQFIVNGRPLFIKGMNWMPADILLDLPRERYRWLLGAAQAAGIQLLRVWGGGLLETEEFYEACNELGLMVWQDFPIGNRDTPEWPQDVWEAQVLQTIFRLRNHPALALWCGGNEFNPYSPGNAATIGIVERNLAEFDPTRPFRRTSPDAGSIHTYPDMDPTWYAKLYQQVPYIAETGMHCVPEAQGILETVTAGELDKPLGGMFERSFPMQHPELRHHFVEYDPARVPRMLSRASHMDDMRAPTLKALAEATQIGAGEFYQIFSEQMQANYPVTAGLMPWVFKRPWPVIAIMLVDGFGQPTAPYYFLKRTYEPTHILVKLPQLLWAKGEEIPLAIHVTHAAPDAMEGFKASVKILGPDLAVCWQQELLLALQPGPAVTVADAGSFKIPDAFEDKFFFVLAELRRDDGQLVSRSVYWPRCLSQMHDAAFRKKQRESPQPMFHLDQGPWLKPQAAAQPAELDLAVVSHRGISADRSRLQVRICNTGNKPAVNTHLDIEGAKRAFYATDNFFWLAPGEVRTLDLEILWRDLSQRQQAVLSIEAWNAKRKSTNIPAS